MSKFNNVKKSEQKTTYEGGKAYKRDSATSWLNFLFSSYLEDTFYENGNAQIKRFIELTSVVGEEYGPVFVAKAADFARNELGMRSVTHLTAAMLNHQKFPYKREYLRRLFYRPDDIGETFAAVEKLGDKHSHALVRAAGDTLSSLSEYQLSKYGDKKAKWNMYDLINVTHAHSAAIDKFKNGTLEEADTWENKISGERGSSENHSEWKRLVEEGKLGYLALIRNLRYIMNIFDIDRSWIVNNLVPQLTNKEKIRKSMVFPYQIYAAYRNMQTSSPVVISALDEAFRIACGNVEELSGDSAVILDVSGSMDDPISGHSMISMKEIGACYAAMLYVSQDCDFIKFGNDAKECEYNKNDNIFDIIEHMTYNENCGYGTDIGSAFKVIYRIDKTYDRLFIISDMQTMSGKNYWTSETPEDLYKKYTPNAHIYSFDLANYRGQCFPSNPKFHFATALNDKVFAFVPYLENDKNLVDYISENY